MTYHWKPIKNKNENVELVLQPDSVRDNVGDPWDDEKKRNYKNNVIYTTTHLSGWKISGKINNQTYVNALRPNMNNMVL